MELGEKLRQARLKAGLSQRKLCGSVITRNMLSQIENGSAHPSMASLRYFAQQLGLPVSYFLEEDGTVSSNQNCMEAAWAAFEAGKPMEALRGLEDYHGNDPLYDREYRLLKAFLLLEEARVCITQGQEVRARQLLMHEEELEFCLSWLPELKNRRIHLLALLGEEYAQEDLPDIDWQLYLRAQAALREGKYVRAAALLDAIENQKTADWYLFRGRAALGNAEYATAADYLQQAESAFPSQAVPLLEQCFRELGDYKMAYDYACRRRDA